MKFGQKINLFFAFFVLALTASFPSRAAQSTSKLVTHFSTIKHKAVNGHAKVKPEELENQISPVFAEIQQIPTIHEDLTNQVLEIMVELAQQERDEAKKLKEELVSLNFTATTPEEIALLPYEVKEKTILSLTFDAVITTFDYLGDILFCSKNPFRIPENTSTISQFDMFLFLGMTLTSQDGNPIREELHSSLMSCVGLRRNVIKIQQRLHKPEIDSYIPRSLMSKFFDTRNPLRIAAIVKHVMNLTVTYTN